MPIWAVLQAANTSEGQRAYWANPGHRQCRGATAQSCVDTIHPGPWRVLEASGVMRWFVFLRFWMFLGQSVKFYQVDKTSLKEVSMCHCCSHIVKACWLWPFLKRRGRMFPQHVHFGGSESSKWSKWSKQDKTSRADVWKNWEELCSRALSHVALIFFI